MTFVLILIVVISSVIAFFCLPLNYAMAIAAESFCFIVYAFDFIEEASNKENVIVPPLANNEEVSRLSSQNSELMSRNLELQKQVISLSSSRSSKTHSKRNKRTLSKVLVNAEEVRREAIRLFKTAKKEIDISCPWINYNALVSEIDGENESLFSVLLDADRRGVVVKISYGMGRDDARAARSRETVDWLMKNFSVKLRVFETASHAKVILIDDSYYIQTSLNLLSNSGNDWEENGSLIENKESVALFRTKFFSF